MSPLEIGKAYKAFLAYNFKAKTDRLKDFNLKRWLKVVKALEEKSPSGLRGTGTWSLTRRKKFEATIAKKKANGKSIHA